MNSLKYFSKSRFSFPFNPDNVLIATVVASFAFMCTNAIIISKLVAEHVVKSTLAQGQGQRS